MDAPCQDGCFGVGGCKGWVGRRGEEREARGLWPGGGGADSGVRSAQGEHTHKITQQTRKHHTAVAAHLVDADARRDLKRLLAREPVRQDRRREQPQRLAHDGLGVREAVQVGVRDGAAAAVGVDLGEEALLVVCCLLVLMLVL